MEVMHRRSWRWTCEHTPTPAFTSKTPTATGAAAGWRFQCDTACGRAPAGLSGSAKLPGKSGVIGSRSAFALIEAVMGSGLLGVLSITLYLAIGQGFAVLQVTRENLRATQILQEKMETIRLYSWDQLNQPGFVPATFTNYFDPSGSPGHQGAVFRGTTIVTNAILTMVNSVYLWYRPGRDAPIECVAATYAELALRGLRARDRA